MTPCRDDLAALMNGRGRRRLLFLILAVGLLARLPGVWWGENFPGGWVGHHPDEFTHVAIAQYLIDPSANSPTDPIRYPKGAAATVAALALVVRAATGQTAATATPAHDLVLAGRLVSVIYGTATVLLLMLIAQRVFRSWPTAALTGAIVALGGLHVSQSHLFLADVPAIFWLWLGLYLLYIDFERRGTGEPDHLYWGAFALGVSFGLKLFVFGLPSLALALLFPGQRLRRVMGTAIFFVAGLAVINLLFFSPHDLRNTLVYGINVPFQYSKLVAAGLYLVELPSIFSLPVMIAAIGGTMMLLQRARRSVDPTRVRAVVACLVAPTLVTIVFIVFKLDPFPRHLVMLLPWIALSAAAGVVTLTEWTRARGWPTWIIVAPVLFWQACFVIDGERVFVRDPRNQVAAFLNEQHLAAGDMCWVRVRECEWNFIPPLPKGPRFLVVEMLEANHFLSGMGWRDSYPSDPARVFASLSPEYLVAVQQLFQDKTVYREVRRFREGYVMPEFTLTDRLIGERSRNYVTTLVLFERRDRVSSPGP